jgi:hypothetical protein
LTAFAVVRRERSVGVSRTSIALAIASASSACNDRMSRELRSKVSAQRCLSSRASINCAVIRTRSPERDTEPSITASTFRRRPISGVGGRSLALNCIADPREITRSWLIVARSAVISSVIPSAK